MTSPAPEHGTRARYLRGCRCEPCTAAHSGYGTNRSRQIAYGRWEPFTDAEPARIRIKELEAAGVTWQQAARLAGVNYWIVRSLLFGYAEGCAPSRRIRRENADRILAVRVPDVRHNAEGLVDAIGTRRRLQALIAVGWTRAALAVEMDREPNFVSQLLKRAQVQEVTAIRVRDLYARLGRPPLPVTGQGRAAAERCRRKAAAKGWPPPAAWDDEALDDPAGRPADGWKRPKRLSSADTADEAADLFRQGYDRSLAAERLGMVRSSLDTALSREQRRQAS